MAKRIRKLERLHEERPAALGELIHAHVRIAIETAVHEELAVALGAGRYERQRERRAYRNGRKVRTTHALDELREAVHRVVYGKGVSPWVTSLATAISKAPAVS